MIDERQMTIEELGALQGLAPDAAEVEAVEEIRERGEPTGEVHPVAELFPMMTDEELNDLAEDIKQHGQMQPITLDIKGVLIDGRNRLEACRRLDKTPWYEWLTNGVDPREFIMSMNDGKRRNSTQGQRAMVAVEAYWDVELDKLSKTQDLVAQKAGVPQARVKEAVAIKKFTPLACASVRSGRKPVSVAYEEAIEAKTRDESDRAKEERLQTQAPDLWEMVKEGTLSLKSALVELEERKEKERRRIDQITRHLDTALNHLDPRSIPLEEYAQQWLDAKPGLIGEHADFSAARARNAAAVLLRYAELKQETEDHE